MEVKNEGNFQVISLTQSDMESQEVMDGFKQLMDAQFGHYEEKVKDVMTELEVDQFCAVDVVYLRSRSRWTPQLEEELVQLHRRGIRPNIFEWPGANQG